VDFAPHRAFERVVDQTLPLHGGLAIELHRDDDGPEMAAARSGTRVTGVQMTLIDHFDVYCGKPLA